MTIFAQSDVPCATRYCIRSAHCNEDLAMDVETFEDRKYNQQVWASFHFLPGNGGLTLEEGTTLSLADKLVCKPNSYIAEELVDEAIKHRNDENSLERLGVTMHVYADTWAHQEFAGVKDRNLNQVEDVSSEVDDDVALDFADRIIIPPLGHMQVWKHPDLPFLNWQMRKNGINIPRDNISVFLDAASNMLAAMQRFIDRLGNIKDISDQDRQSLINVMKNVRSKEEDQRLEEWAKAISIGEFSFGAEELPRYDKSKYERIEWDNTSDFIEWKKFHDALHEHRDFLFENLLPKYGLLFTY